MNHDVSCLWMTMSVLMIFFHECVNEKKLMNNVNNEWTGWSIYIYISIWSMVHDGTMNGWKTSCWIWFFICSQDSHKMIHYAIYWISWPRLIIFWSIGAIDPAHEIPPAGSSAILPPRTAALHWASDGNEKGVMALGSHRISCQNHNKKQFIIGIHEQISDWSITHYTQIQIKIRSSNDLNVIHIPKQGDTYTSKPIAFCISHDHQALDSGCPYSWDTDVGWILLFINLHMFVCSLVS